MEVLLDEAGVVTVEEREPWLRYVYRSSGVRQLGDNEGGVVRKRGSTNTPTHPKCVMLGLHDLVQKFLPQQNLCLLSQEEWWFPHLCSQQVLVHSLNTGLMTGVKTQKEREKQRGELWV